MKSLVGSGLVAAADVPRFVRRGHFAYEGGDHGDTALALELLFADPARLHRAASELARRMEGLEIDVVCGPLVGGALAGQAVAAELGAGFVYAERLGGAYAIPNELARGLAGKRVVIVDDVINAGSASASCIRSIQALDGTVAGVACLAVREGAETLLAERLGHEVLALVTLAWNTWRPDDCPLCVAGVTLFDATP
jgi:orotate phosphoribosyltransferase